MAIWDYVLVALWGSIAQRNGNAIGSCLRCCSEDTGTLSGDFAASSTDSACPDALSTVRGRFAPAAFDTRPLPPYNAPLVRANSASAIILLWAFCPHPTHSARRRFRRALTRLALFSVSNGVLGVLPCRPRRPVSPCVRMRDGGSNANDSSLHIERDFLGFPQ